jgi:2-methylisocitrate lyase-like PEP mutase family enzyme
MTNQREKAERFRALHHQDRPLLLANAWDAGSAKLLHWLGFQALATTGSGFGASPGRRDHSVSREEAPARAGVPPERALRRCQSWPPWG